MKAKPRTTYTVFVRHLNQYSRKFIVTAKSEYFARQMIREMISALPLDQRHGTFDGTRLTLNVNKLPDYESELLWLTEAEEFAVASTDTIQPLPTERILQIAAGSVMKGLRQHLQLSQREFAINAGLRQPTVGVLERGETGMRLYNFLKIAYALGKNPDDLLRIVSEEYDHLASASRR
jgi:DNA-binding XRE family transcriptional regulator